MKNRPSKLCFLLLITTFLSVWISDGLCMTIENDKYDFSKTIEDSDTENQTENKSKTEFINEIALLDFTNFYFSNTQKNTPFYLFKIKEFSFENQTPPPEIV
jgi:hypothetical protein